MTQCSLLFIILYSKLFAIDARNLNTTFFLLSLQIFKFETAQCNKMHLIKLILTFSSYEVFQTGQDLALQFTLTYNNSNVKKKTKTRYRV